MKKILVLNGPNLNMLGVREPDKYGSETYESLCARLTAYGARVGAEVVCRQSNHEGTLVDMIQEALGVYDGIVFNPGAYTHTSIALLDALRAVKIPCVEVHISDVRAREAYRQVSYVREACFATVMGHGTDGYAEGIDLVLSHLEAQA